MRPHRRAAGCLLLVALAAACSRPAAPAVGPATPTVRATVVAQPVETPSPSPPPADDGGDAAPLTGLPLPPGADAGRAALVAKVENTRQAWPQAGLEVADLVVEEVVEGGITRFVAVFQSQLPEVVGPIRSARFVDAALLPWLDGVLLYSGARPEVEGALIGTGVTLVTEDDPGVYRDPERARSHDLFARPAEALAAVDTTDVDPPRLGWGLDHDPPADARACDDVDDGCDGTRLDVVMSVSARTGWTYDADDGVYRRDQDGTPQPTASGDPVGAANVVVLGVGIGTGGCCDAGGAPYVTTTTIGTGRAIVLRDGRWYEARWEREDVDEPFSLLRDDEQLALRPGPTWLHLAPVDRLPPAPGDGG